MPQPSRCAVLTVPNTEHLLDNPIFASLATRHAGIAQGSALAWRFPADVSPLAGVAVPDAAHVAALRTVVPTGDDVGLFTAQPLALDAAWDVRMRLEIVQMIRRTSEPLAEDVQVSSVPLGVADHDAVMALVDLTHPGPFRARTLALGGFIGVYAQGLLQAMTGQRLWTDRFHEVSGVCTHPAARGHGLARALIAQVVNRMLRAGEVPFLHVESGNAGAIALYESLGFARRTQFALVHAAAR